MAYTTAILTGHYLTTSGEPAEGVVEIIPNSRQIVDPAGEVILSGRVKVALEAGAFTVVLPATDDATLEPATGRQYTVVAKLRHAHLPAVTGVELAGGSTVDVASVSSMPVVDATTTNAATTAQLQALETAFAADLAGKQDAGDYATTTDLASKADVTALDGKADVADIPTTPAQVGAEPAGLSTTTNANLASTYVKPLNVLAYGAAGDGTTDDTAAIQAALAAATTQGGGTVFFPEGTYRVTSTLTVTGAADSDTPSWQGGGIHLVGISARHTVIRAEGGITLLDFTPNLSAFCSIEKLTLKGPGKATAGSVALDAYQTPHLRIDQVYIRDFQIGAQSYDCTGWTWTDVRTWYCGTGIRLGYNSDSMVFASCEWRISDTALLIGWATGAHTGSQQFCNAVTFLGCIFAYNVGPAVEISDMDAHGITFDRCYWEGNPKEVNVGVSGRADGRGPSLDFNGCFFSATVAPPLAVGIDIYNKAAARFLGCSTDGDNRYTVFVKVADPNSTKVRLDECKINAVTAALQVGSRNYNTTVTHRESFHWAGQRSEMIDYGFFPAGPAKRTLTYNSSARQIETWGRSTGAGAVVNEFEVADVGGGVLVARGVTSAFIAATSLATLPTASANYRGCFAYVPGNGTTTADTLYVCLMSATGTYSWKSIVAG